MKTNGGLTQVNKQAVEFALTNSNLIFKNVSVSSWNTTETNQFKFNSFMFLLRNPNSTGSSLIKHLTDNKWSEESTLFAKELISQMAQNPDLSLDVDASFKSPFNIDRSAIDKNTPEGAKFDMVYESLMTSPTFKKLFVDLFGNNDRFCVDLKLLRYRIVQMGLQPPLKAIQS